MVAKINLEIITNRLNLRVSDLCKLFQSIEGNIIPVYKGKCFMLNFQLINSGKKKRLYF